MSILVNGLRSVRDRQVWTDRRWLELTRRGFDGFDELLTTCADVNRSPCLGITHTSFGLWPPNLDADRVRVVDGTDVPLKKGKSHDEGHNGA